MNRVLVVVALGLGSCSDASGNEDCVQIARSSLRISVLDASNDAAICGATIVVTRDGRSEMVNAGPAPRCLYSAGNEPGRFTVEIAADGYRAAEPIMVTVPKEDACPQPVTQEVTARLEPE
jgi:hypothetical protein